MEKFAVKSNNIQYLVVFGGILFLTNLIIGINLELSYDEAYYWVYSQFLDWGYYDHPPLIALSIAIGTFFFGNTEFGVRFFPFLYLIGTVWFLLKTLSFDDSRKNFALMLFSMPLLVFSGIFALPDAPLMFFVAMFFYAVKRYLLIDSVVNSIWVMVAIVGMFYSKYHGLLIVILTLLAHFDFVKRKSFWGIIAGVLVLYFPHVWWQFKNDFITFKFHLTGRVEKHFNIFNILDYISGQIVLMGLLNFYLFMNILHRFRTQNRFERILFFNSAGFLIFLFFVSFRNQVEANWTLSCSMAIILLFATLLKHKEKLVLYLAIPSIFLHLVFKGILMFPASFADIGEENRLNEVYGWKESRFVEIFNACEDGVLVADNYQIASKISFYSGRVIPALHIRSRDSQFSMLNLQKNLAADDKICYLTTKNLKNSIVIETKFKDPVYVLPDTSLEWLAKRYKISYEKITGN